MKSNLFSNLNVLENYIFIILTRKVFGSALHFTKLCVADHNCLHVLLNLLAQKLGQLHTLIVKNPQQ